MREYLAAVAQPPTDMEMNETGQTIFTIGVAIPWVVLMVVAIRLLAVKRDPMMLLFLVGGALAIFMEPIVDVMGHCYFPRENQWVGIEVFDRPIPAFMWFVYSWYVGGEAYLFYLLFKRGMSRSLLWLLWVAGGLVDVVLETPGILMDVYTYYGDNQPFNPWGLPLWWPGVNATMPMVAGFAVYKLAPLLKGWRILAVIPLVPMADGVSNAAAGIPVWTALNTDYGKPLTFPAAVASYALAAFVVWIISENMKPPAEQPATGSRRDPEPALTGDSV